MKTIPLSELATHHGETVRVRGFVHALRQHRNVVFVVLRDRSGLGQLVTNAAVTRDVTRESAVVATGIAAANPRVRMGGAELHLSDLEVVGPASGPLPLTPGEAEQPGVEHRFDWRYLDLRRPAAALIFEVQTALVQAMRAVWAREDFVEIHTPKLLEHATESGAEVFRLDYFGRPACLAQSPQFYKQMAIAAGLERVFEIGPVFRAEHSFTNRHTTEFTSVDVEIAWIESVEDVMAFEERWLQAALSEVVATHGERIRAHLGIEPVAPTTPFPRIDWEAATELLGVKTLDTHAELRLGAWALERFGHEFLFVTGYPASERPFYHRREGALTCSYDLLWRGVEITTGAQREHRPEVLTEQAREAGLDLGGLEGYLAFFRHGCPPHGGFGLGLARLLMLLLDRHGIRETTLLPRTPNRLVP